MVEKACAKPPKKRNGKYSKSMQACSLHDDAAEARASSSDGSSASSGGSAGAPRRQLRLIVDPLLDVSRLLEDGAHKTLAKRRRRERE